MHNRPAAIAVASVLVAATGFGFAVGGFLLVAVAFGGLGFLGFGHGAAVIATMGLVSLVLAAGAWLAAADLSRGHARGWAASLVIAFVALDAALTAVLTTDVEAPLLVGLAMTVATVVALIAPHTRRAVRVPGVATAH